MGIYYNPKLVTYARFRRKEQTPAEAVLWKFIRKKQVHNIKFRRQYPILNFILDFYAPGIKLAIEIDGMSHDDKKYKYDRKREVEIENLGIEILRFSEFEVRTRLYEVLNTLNNKIEDITSPTPP